MAPASCSPPGSPPRTTSTTAAAERCQCCTPDGSANVAPGLLAALTGAVGIDVSAQDLVAYLAAVVAHPAYTRRFTDELTTPGIRVPVTTDGSLWHEAVEIGRQVVWLHTYGARSADAEDGPPPGSVRYPAGDPRQPLSLTAVTTVPDTMTYDPEARVLRLGTGTWGPVTPAVWGYAVGGKQVLRSWFNYRKANPGGTKTSPPDDIHVDAWPAEWTTELVDLLTVLTRLVEEQDRQADLLDRVLGGPLATAETLSAAGVRWPTTPVTECRATRCP